MPARACRACLAIDLKLFNIFQQNLNGLFEEVIGIPILESDDNPQYICAMCNARLLKYNNFRNQVHLVQNLLATLKLNDIELTTSFIKTIDRKKCGLLLNLETFTPPASNLDLEEIEIIEEIPEQLPYPLTETDQNSDQPSVPGDTVDQLVEPWSDDDNKSESDTPAETYEPKTPVVTRTEISKSYYEDPQNLEEFKQRYNVDVVFLTKEQQIKEAHDRIQEALTSNSKLYCTVCGKKFLNSTALEKHKDLYHDDAMGVACEICRCCFAEASLTDHMDTHRMLVKCRLCDFTTYGPHKIASHARKHGTDLYNCDHCEATFLEKRLLRAHLKEHFPSPELWCRFCGDTASTKPYMRRHVIRYHKQILDSEYFCRKCEVKFASKSALETHFTSTCDEFNCCVCGIHLDTMESLRDHVRSSHSRHVRLEQCLGCGVKFFGVKSLEKHKEDGCGTGRPCEECGETFPDVKTLLAHKWDFHTILYRACNICEIILPPKKYKQHMKDTHHTVTKRSKPAVPRYLTKIWSVQDGGFKCVKLADLKSNRTDQPTETHICEICGKVYTRFNSFKSHRRAHEKRYRCELCGLGMARKTTYEHHIRLHNGERPCKCRFCPKTFRTDDTLRRHIKIHFNVRPHVCQDCGKKFRTSTSIRAHIRSVHLKLPARARAPRPKYDVDESQGLDESQSLVDESRGYADESQGHMDESQGHVIEIQGHMDESQGQVIKSQDQMANDEQMNAVNSILNSSVAIDSEGFIDSETGLRVYPVKENTKRQTLRKPRSKPGVDLVAYKLDIAPGKVRFKPVRDFAVPKKKIDHNTDDVPRIVNTVHIKSRKKRTGKSVRTHAQNAHKQDYVDNTHTQDYMDNPHTQDHMDNTHTQDYADSHTQDLIETHQYTDDSNVKVYTTLSADSSKTNFNRTKRIKKVKISEKSMPSLNLEDSYTVEQYIVQDVNMDSDEQNTVNMGDITCVSHIENNMESEGSHSIHTSSSNDIILYRKDDGSCKFGIGTRTSKS